MSVNSFSGQPAIPTSYGFTAGKNKVINGDFGIWQRGTSFTNPASGTYLADRWTHYFDGTGSTRVISQQTFTPGSAPVAGYEGTYFLRYNQSVAGSGSTYGDLEQRIEDVRVFAGQTVTFSFWAKADTTRTISAQISQNFGTGGSTVAYGSAINVTVTSSWARYSVTYAVPSIAGKTIGPNSFINVSWNLPLNTTFTLDFWGIQCEAGATATSFQTATGTVQGELAACQRYYTRATVNGGSYQYLTNVGSAISTTVVGNCISLPVSLRTVPTAVDYSSLAVTADNATVAAVSAVAISNASSAAAPFLTFTSTGLTQFRPYWVCANNSGTAYIGLSAEL